MSNCIVWILSKYVGRVWYRFAGQIAAFCEHGDETGFHKSVGGGGEVLGQLRKTKRFKEKPQQAMGWLVEQ